MLRVLSRTRISTSQRLFNMPLKAKIDPSSPISTDSSLASTSTNVPDDVLFSTHHHLQKITLNRPKKLNSLDLSMIDKIHPRLEAYAKARDVKVVLINGSGRAFCAGGDVAALAESNKAGEHHKGKHYFASEYRLDHLIATFSKPIVVLVDGICMGGGVGLTINAPIRVITEKSVLAMPESTIGFFPDVGASRFLSKLGSVGKYLACTAHRLEGAQIVLSGLGTHYVASARISELEHALGEMTTTDLKSIQDLIATYTEPITETFKLGSHATELAAFEAASLPQVLANLDAIDSEFAKDTAKTMRQKSPISLAVALKAQQLGQHWSIREVFEQEYNIACKFMHNPDFIEGVESTLKHRRLGEWQEKRVDVNVDDYFTGRAKLF